MKSDSLFDVITINICTSIVTRPPTIRTCHAKVKVGRVTDVPDGPEKPCGETTNVWLNRNDRDITNINFKIMADLIITYPPVHSMYMDDSWGQTGIVGGHVQSWHKSDVSQPGQNI